MKATTPATPEQIAKCHRVIDEETKLPFYMVESEHDSLTEYKVSTIWKYERWFVICTCPAGLNGKACKHVRWAKAAAQEYKEELAIAAKCVATAAPQIKELPYSDVDGQTLARVMRRSEEKASKSVKNVPLRQGRGFSLLK